MPVPQPYRITLMLMLSTAVLLRRALIFGRSQRLADCFERVESHLETRPLEWDEASARLQSAKLLVCAGFEDRICVEYLVHEVACEVFIMKLGPQPGHPLYAEPDL